MSPISRGHILIRPRLLGRSMATPKGFGGTAGVRKKCWDTVHCVDLAYFFFKTNFWTIRLIRIVKSIELFFLQFLSTKVPRCCTIPAPRFQENVRTLWYALNGPYGDAVRALHKLWVASCTKLSSDQNPGYLLYTYI